MPSHESQTDAQGLHLPKNFSTAAINTVAAKNASGVLEWLPKAELGGIGPQGTTLQSVATADIDNPDLSGKGGVQGDTIKTYQSVAAGINKSRSYMFDADVVTADPPRIVTGSGGTWHLTEDAKLTDDIIRASSTGTIKDGQLTVNADTTKFDRAAGSGTVVDSHTNPSKPMIKTVNFAQRTAQVPTFIATKALSFIGTDADGEIVQSDLPFSSSERRDIIVHGAIIHNDNVNINLTIDQMFPIMSPLSQLIDLFQAIGTVNTAGNVYSANGVNLNIDKSAGIIVGASVNPSSSKNPNELPTIELIVVNFFRSVLDTGVFTVSGTFTAIDTANYNGPNGLIAVPNNLFQIIRFFYIGAGEQTILQQGQNTYASIALAEAVLKTETFAKDPSLIGVPLRGYLIVQQGAADLSDLALAKFINGDKIDLA